LPTRKSGRSASLWRAGEIGKQALTACLRTLVVILSAILRDVASWLPA
jgi:hypothetical protein